MIKGSCTFSGNPLKDNKTVQKEVEILLILLLSLYKRNLLYIVIGINPRLDGFNLPS